MPAFSSRSRERLASCDSRLQLVMNKVIQVLDITVLEGHRLVSRQQQLYRQGRFGNDGPIVTNIDGIRVRGKHNWQPSKAIDVAPYPLDWNDRERFVYMAGIVLGIAHANGIDLRWGGDWDEDNDLRDHNSPMDLPHFEIKD